MQKVLLLTLAVVFSLSAKAQFSPERMALNRMQKGKWKSAEESLRKALRKDSINAEAEFIFSSFFSALENPAANIDSAYRYSLLAMHDFSRGSLREKDRLKRFPIDSQVLIHQRKKIDSTAFERAKLLNTEQGYIDFLLRFKFASERPAAVELRDEVAFLGALKTNSYKSFMDYLQRYPASARAGDARQRYEKLLYADKTRDGKLNSYETFYKEYPLSPFHSEAEKIIFEIRTASGRVSALNEFLARYPSSRFRTKITSILYHLLKEEEKETKPLSDSLKEVQRQELGYYIPVYKSGKFGFIDQLGNEAIKPQFDSIRLEYICGNIRTDYLSVSGGIINRAGNWIARDHITDVQDLGAGFLKVTSAKCRYFVHKSGWGFSNPCHDDVKLIARNFLAFNDHGQWGLTTLVGKVLFTPQFDDVLAVDTLILLVKSGKKSLVTIDQVAAVANQTQLVSTLVFDDVRWLAKGNYGVKNGALEGVINEKLKFIVPLDRQTITRSSAGFILDRNKRYALAGISPVVDQKEYDQVRFYGQWIKLQKGNDLQLYDIRKKKIEISSLDSLSFENELAFAYKNDSLRVYLKSGYSLDFPSEAQVNFIKSVDSSLYFFIPEKNKKILIQAATGARLFTFEADELEYIGNSVFLISKGSKRGLLNHDGKILLPLEYSAIVPLGTEWASLFKDKKFGLYHLTTHKLVKPAYDRNVIPFSKNLLTAYKDGAYGFIDLESKPQSNFEFEEIRPWNDTASWVKKNFKWMIYAISAKKTVIDNIKDYHYILDSPAEKLAVIRRDVYYGVISNKRGEIIPSSFSEIVNVGSPEEPMYFCEKNVEEAGIHVVIYYDKNGKLLRKQAYEDEEYERIYCEGN